MSRGEVWKKEKFFRISTLSFCGRRRSGEILIPGEVFRFKSLYFVDSVLNYVVFLKSWERGFNGECSVLHAHTEIHY